MHFSHVWIDRYSDDNLSLAAQHALGGLHESTLLPAWSASDAGNELPSLTTASGLMQQTSSNAAVPEVIDASFRVPRSISLSAGGALEQTY